VLTYTRRLSAWITPLLVVAFVVLYVFPGRTAQLWAWTDPATMTPMVLASAYLGGASFFLRVQRSRAWHEVATGFLAAALFASLLAIATVVHWDEFTHSNVAFWVWFVVYVATPFLVFRGWFVNRRYAAPVLAIDAKMHPVERVLIGAVGLSALAFGAVMYVSPSSVVDQWPWPLTSLSCQVLGATVCLGGAGVVTWFDPRWTSLRLLVRVEVVMLVAMLLAGSAYLWTTHEPTAPARVPEESG